MEIRDIDIEDIYVGERLRRPSEAAVEALANSMRAIGLKTPITVRVVEKMEIDGEEIWGVPVLVAGATRIAAAKQLGWSAISCSIVDTDDIDALMWEIAENLHRSELTVQERSEHIAKWVELLEAKRLSAQVGPKGHRPESGINAAARDLGIERKQAQRAVKIAAIVPEAKEAAAAAGLADNQSALLRVASQPAHEQVLEVERIAATKVKPVKLPDEPINDFEATQKQVAALMNAWNKAGPEAREQFLARVDTGVFDRTSSGRAA